MLFFPLAVAALFPGLSFAQTLDANSVSLEEKVLAIERLMLTPGTIDFQVAPCKFLLHGPPNEDAFQTGEQTSAHWIRTAFHDFITANVTNGTGGLDASIGFESGRPENNGTIELDRQNFIDRTIVGFNLFSNVFISMADFIALGVAETLLSCDHSAPMMQLRVGRIDATSAGPTGVPEAHQSLNSHRAAFAKAGMSQTEMIQAVACGHTIGGVHGFTFPDIVGSQPTYGSSKTDFFDDSPYLFDNVGLVNYLAGTNKAGGPLVTSANSTLRSDARIFKSDNNATVTAMAASQSAFRNTCIKVFEKMIHTIPASNPPLSAPIGPRKFITKFGYVDLVGTNVKFFGRVVTWGSISAMPNKVSYVFGTTSTSGVAGIGATGNTSNIDFPTQRANGENIIGGERFPFFGNTSHYDFNTTISTTTTSLKIQNVYNETVNTKLFVLPSLSFRSGSGPGSKWLVRAALLTSLAPSGTQVKATLYYAAAQAGTKSPLYKRFTITLSPLRTIGSYSIYSGIITQPSDQPADGGGATAIDVIKVGTTLKSSKIEIGSIAPDLIKICSNTDLTTCT